jgi:hypothetical protein
MNQSNYFAMNKGEKLVNIIKIIYGYFSHALINYWHSIPRNLEEEMHSFLPLHEIDFCNFNHDFMKAIF